MARLIYGHNFTPGGVMPTIMSVAVINVPVKVGPAAWGECFDKAANRAKRGAFGINETLTPAQRDLYREKARARGLGWFGLRTGNAVFWDRSRWRRVAAHVVTLHPRGESTIARRWPGYNAARTAVVVVLEDRRTGEQVTMICTHWAPQGKKVPAAWGAWARQEARRQVRDAIREHQAAGRVVWLLGDLNVKSVVRMNLRGFRWLRRYGVDKVGIALPRELRLSQGAAGTFIAPTDHRHGVRAIAKWRTR